MQLRNYFAKISNFIQGVCNYDALVCNATMTLLQFFLSFTAQSLMDSNTEMLSGHITLERVQSMISFMLRNGVRDHKHHLFSCSLGHYSDLVKFILKHKAHVDNQRKLPHHAHTINQVCIYLHNLSAQRIEIVILKIVIRM